MTLPLRPERLRPGRACRIFPILAVCVAIAGAAVMVLDQYSAAEDQQELDASPIDQSWVQPPSYPIWDIAPLHAGTPAPAFRLPDVKTGALVSLDDFRGRPVVLLLSSFG